MTNPATGRDGVHLVHLAVGLSASCHQNGTRGIGPATRNDPPGRERVVTRATASYVAGVDIGPLLSA